jgi:thiol-disulfide isomerase/thioredoxin
MTTGLLVAAAVLVLGTGIGLWRRHTDGRFHPVAEPRTTHPATTAPAPAPTPGAEPRDGGSVDVSAASVTSAELVPAEAGEGGTLPIVGVGAVGAAADALDAELLARLGVGAAPATLLQFSSAFCAPCRALRRVAGEVAAMVPGVQHVEVDAESHLDVVRQLGIWRTPTLLVLDAGGRVAKRASGVPTKPQLIAALGEVIGESAPDRA